MGYQFDTAAEFISYGSHVALYQSQDLSLGFWLYYLSATDGKQIIAQNDNFPIIQCSTRADITNGLGVNAHHVLGGSFEFGVDIVPGAVNPAFKMNVNQWMYFGISRAYGSKTYFSVFGSKTVLVDGPQATWAPGQDPFPFSTPGQGLGPWQVGAQGTGFIVGPASYWSRFLLKSEHLLLARCELPDPTGLLWRTKMFEGAADIGPAMYTATFSTPGPLYVPDDGCQSFGSGLDYRLYNT
jgi:hypothetical protein